MRKTHLLSSNNHGVTCQRGHSGGALRGEHFTVPFAEFIAAPVDQQCAKCRASKRFAFLQREADKKAPTEWKPNPDAWEPVADANAWKAQDDALIAANRARKARAA